MSYQYIPYLGTGTNQILIGAIDSSGKTNPSIIPVYNGDSLTSIIADDNTPSSLLAWSHESGWALIEKDDLFGDLDSNLATLLRPQENGVYALKWSDYSDSGSETVGVLSYTVPLNEELMQTANVGTTGSYILGATVDSDSSTVSYVLQSVPTWFDATSNVANTNALFVYNSSTNQFTYLSIPSSSEDYVIHYDLNTISLIPTSTTANLNSLVGSFQENLGTASYSDSSCVLLTDIKSNTGAVDTVNVYYKMYFYLNSIINYPTVGTYNAVLDSTSCPLVTVAFSSTDASTAIDSSSDSIQIQPLIPLMPFQGISGVFKNVQVGGTAPKYVKFSVSDLTADFTVRVFPTLSEVAIL